MAVKPGASVKFNNMEFAGGARAVNKARFGPERTLVGNFQEVRFWHSTAGRHAIEKWQWSVKAAIRSEWSDWKKIGLPPFWWTVQKDPFD